jgi:hypothetical protein
MKKLRRGIGAIAVSLAVLTIPLAASADSSQSVNVNASINPATPSSFGLNFNGLNFSGDVGNNVSGSATQDGTGVNIPKYTVSSTLNFDVYVKGTDFVNSNGEQLTSRRLQVTQYQPSPYYSNPDDYPYWNWEGSAQINKELTKLYSGSNQSNQAHTLQFNLDLTTQNNNYADNSVLTNLKNNQQFSSQVTFTYTGL